MFSGGSGNAPEVEYAAVIQRGRNDLETSEVLLPAMVTMNNNGSETNDFAIIFQNLCNYYYKEHKDSIRIQEEWNATETASRWKKERDTWSLIEQLYGERLSSLMEEEEDVSQRMVLEEGGIKGETDFTRVQSLLKKDQSLREYLIVRRWLEDNAPEFRQVETRKGYWLYTRKRLKESNMSSGAMGSQQHGKGTTTTSSPALLFGGMPAVPGGGGGGGGGGSNRGETTIISAMDPDAPSRQKRSIVPDDAEWEQSFLRTLYEYVRRGKMDDA
ncbi:Nucleoporin nup84, partial [Spiromyces aspiralis]